jgi:hydroxymethylpyrimidine pyrophosphatase-like HAD family hydrolase
MQGLILLDWDETLVDKEIKINDARLNEVLRTRMEEGWVIGLNSDTPFRRLHNWWQSLGLNGPIVAERGAVVWWPGSPPCVISESRALFAGIRHEITDAIMDSEDYALFYGDSTEFIRSVNHIRIADKILVSFDAYRLCSVGMFVRVIVDGEPTKDKAALERIERLVTDIVPHHPLVSPVLVEREVSYIWLNCTDVDKTKGVIALLKHSETPGRIIMIGNSMNDYIDLPEVDHFAVGNAEQAFKKLALLVASDEYAKGCVELLGAL